ncbi:serine/threonine protein kinase, partial [Acinetobacter baumannii]
NLLLHSSGELYLIDFGAANELIGQATGTLIGKQSYIAPEQLQGKAIPASDIYALGATLYFLISGQAPTPLTELHPANDGTIC